MDRTTIYNYEKNDKFLNTIKRTRARILAGLEEALFTEGKSGQIFLAKNYGYADKQEQSITFNPANLTDEEIENLIKKANNDG